MDQYLHTLDKLFKGREYGDLPGVLKTSLGCLFKLAKGTSDKINQHYDLYYDILTRTQEHHQAIERQLTRLKADNFSEESVIDPRSFIRKQNGLDKIMIEQVKTLTQALIDRRMEEIEGELINRHDFSLQIKLLEQQLEGLSQKLQVVNQRKVSGDQFQFKIKEQKIQLYEELSRSSRFNGNQLTERESSKILKVENDIENIRHSMRSSLSQDITKGFEDLRFCLQKKVDKKDFSQFRSKTNKEIASKLSSQEIEPILSQFQSKIFDRLNQTTTNSRQNETNIVSIVKSELSLYLKETEHKQKRVKKVEKQLEKVERRVQSELKRKEVGQQDYNCLLDSHLILKEQLVRLQSWTKSQLSSLLLLFSSQIQPVKSTHTFNLSTQPRIISSLKLMSSSVDTKNKFVPWEDQEVNLHRENYLWQRNKTSVCIVCPGLYFVKVCVSSPRKITANLVLNGEYTIQLKGQNDQWIYKEGRVLYYVGVIIVPQKGKLSVRVSDQGRVDAVICLNKMI